MEAKEEELEESDLFQAGAAVGAEGAVLDRNSERKAPMRKDSGFGAPKCAYFPGPSAHGDG